MVVVVEMVPKGPTRRQGRRWWWGEKTMVGKRKRRRRVVVQVVMRRSFSLPFRSPLPLSLPFSPLQLPSSLLLLSLLCPSQRFLFPVDLLPGLFLLFLETLPLHEQEANMLALGGAFLL